MKYISFAALVSVLLGAGQVQAVPGWTPSPLLAARLAPAATEAGFQVRPPLGYTGPHKSSIQVSIYRWNGPDQPDGHRMFFSVASILQPPAMPKRTLLQMFAGMMAVFRNEYTNLKVTPAQVGLIHGTLFIRCHWSGTDKETGRRMQGFDYVGQVGNAVYDLSADGSASYSQSQLDLAEASALTFQRK